MPLPTRPLIMEDASTSVVEALQTASHMYVFRGGVVPSLAPRYQGPYLVLSRGDKCFRLAVGNKEEMVLISRLKPHMGVGPVKAAQPPRWGRPPALSRLTNPDPTAPSWAAVVTRGCGQPAPRAASTLQCRGLGEAKWRTAAYIYTYVEDTVKKTPKVVVIDNH